MLTERVGPASAPALSYLKYEPTDAANVDRESDIHETQEALIGARVAITAGSRLYLEQAAQKLEYAAQALRAGSLVAQARQLRNVARTDDFNHALSFLKKAVTEFVAVREDLQKTNECTVVYLVHDNEC